MRMELRVQATKRLTVGQKIERDHQRFKKIVRRKVKSNLSKYISRGEMIGKKGNDLVSIPLPQIEIPQRSAADVAAFLKAR